MRVQSRVTRLQQPTNEVKTGSRHVREPIRTCVGCRRTGTRSALVRLVVDPLEQRDDRGEHTAKIIVDVDRSLPGRGAWLHLGSRCWELAQHRRAVTRALRITGRFDDSSVGVWLRENVIA